MLAFATDFCHQLLLRESNLDMIPMQMTNPYARGNVANGAACIKGFGTSRCALFVPTASGQLRTW
jgi:hypothetical protein